MARSVNTSQPSSRLRPRSSRALSSSQPTNMPSMSFVAQPQANINLGRLSTPVLVQPSSESRPRVRSRLTQQSHSQAGPSESLIPNPPLLTSSSEITTCPMCALQVAEEGPGLLCEKCMTWFHPECLFLSSE